MTSFASCEMLEGRKMTFASLVATENLCSSNRGKRTVLPKPETPAWAARPPRSTKRPLARRAHAPPPSTLVASMYAASPPPTPRPYITVVPLLACSKPNRIATENRSTLPTAVHHHWWGLRRGIGGLQRKWVRRRPYTGRGWRSLASGPTLHRRPSSRRRRTSTFWPSPGAARGESQV